MVLLLSLKSIQRISLKKMIRYFAMMSTDSLKVSLKAEFLHNGNTFPPLPLATNMKESYENMKLSLENIKHEKYNRNICGDLKVTALLLGYSKVLLLSVSVE
jgi:hypothetical protein